jgi:hypothetical protein
VLRYSIPLKADLIQRRLAGHSGACFWRRRIKRHRRRRNRSQSWRHQQYLPWSSSNGDSGSDKGLVIGLSIFGVLVALAIIATIGILYRRHKAQKAAQGGAYRRVEGSHLGPGTTGPENRDPTWQTSMPNLSAEHGSARVAPK